MLKLIILSFCGIWLLSNCNLKYNNGLNKDKIDQDGRSLEFIVPDGFSKTLDENCVIYSDTFNFGFNCYDIDSAVFYLNPIIHACIGYLIRDLSSNEVINLKNLDTNQINLNNYFTNENDVNNYQSYNLIKIDSLKFIKIESYNMDNSIKRYVYNLTIQGIINEKEVKIIVLAYPQNITDLNHLENICNNLIKSFKIL